MRYYSIHKYNTEDIWYSTVFVLKDTNSNQCINGRDIASLITVFKQPNLFKIASIDLSRRPPISEPIYFGNTNDDTKFTVKEMLDQFPEYFI